MKTPDVIKKGLECWAKGLECTGSSCQYWHIAPCKQKIFQDALEYIKELEARTGLNTLRDAIYEDAVKHGLWERDYGPTDCAELILDEASELDSAAIDWECDDYNDDSEFCEELADVIITALSIAGALGIDIDKAVRRKMEFNKGRSWKHGKENEGEA